MAINANFKDNEREKGAVLRDKFVDSILMHLGHNNKLQFKCINLAFSDI